MIRKRPPIARLSPPERAPSPPPGCGMLGLEHSEAIRGRMLAGCVKYGRRVALCAPWPQSRGRVGPDGDLVEGEGSINPAAYHIHHPLLARPDVVSAAHAHTGWGTPFSAERRSILPITQESCHFFEDHALFDDEEVAVQSVDGGRHRRRARTKPCGDPV